MKKFIYSIYTKLAAVILFIICIAMGTLILTDGFTDFFNEKDYYIYGFENSFLESGHINTILNSVENSVYSTYANFSEDGSPQGKKESVNGMTFDEYLQKRLDNLSYADKINYFVSINDKVYTNCGAANADELRNSLIYKYGLKESNGYTERYTSGHRHGADYLEYIAELNKTDAITVCVSIKDAYARECEELWKAQEELFRTVFIKTFIFFILALLLLIYLICVSGKAADGSLKNIWVDSVWTEIHFVIAVIAGVGAVSVCVILLDEIQGGNLPLYIVRIGTVFSAAVGSAAVLTSLLSIIRKIKCRRFVETSIAFRTVRWAWQIFVRLVKWTCRNIRNFKSVMSEVLSGKTGVILISMLFIYTAVIGFCGILTPESSFFLFAGIVLFALPLLLWRTGQRILMR
ncbi:MAG: hypothetical protein J6N52_12200 [Clostridia bacterium]|nr:hypothetical protein [Clostridia bacterium]